MSVVGDRVGNFIEKAADTGSFVNGGFFVLSPRVIDYIDDDDTVWEHGPLQRLAADGQLYAFRHTGFWQPMDTLRERESLELLWADNPPWKKW
jgi:glucose-1-phosphate cytidylyltransferase